RHDTYILDSYTGAVLKKDLWKNKNSGERYEDANLNIHIGAILGLPGKILAFIVSLIAASLPITGLYIWLGRKKKKKQPAVSMNISSTAKPILEECLNEYRMLLGMVKVDEKKEVALTLTDPEPQAAFHSTL